LRKSPLCKYLIELWNAGDQKSAATTLIKDRIKELKAAGKRKTLRGLGQAMGGLDGSRLTEIMAGTRRVQPSEVGPMAEYLEMAHNDVYAKLFGIVPESIPKNGSHAPVTNRVDNSPTVLVPLWEIALPGGTGSGGTLQLVKTASWTAAPQDLRLSTETFATQVWDDDHAPWLARGSTLFVNPLKKPRDGQWAFFLGADDREAGIIQKPCIAVLLNRRSGGWNIQRGMVKSVLPLTDYPMCWLIEFIKP
jgi:hypothetical protein